jgi:hypothetical protein
LIRPEATGYGLVYVGYVIQFEGFLH